MLQILKLLNLKVAHLNETEMPIGDKEKAVIVTLVNSPTSSLVLGN